MKKSCINCAFCVSDSRLRDCSSIEILESIQRKGDFSFLITDPGISRKYLKCYLGYWDQYPSSLPTNDELLTYFPCDKKHFYQFDKIGNKLLPRLEKEIEENISKINLKWTRISAIAAIVGAIGGAIVIWHLILRGYRYLGHLLT